MFSHGSRRSWVTALLAASIAAVGLMPANALGKKHHRRVVKPAKGAIFQANCKKTDGQLMCPGQLKTSDDGKYVEEFHYYSDCTGLPAVVMKVKIRRRGLVRFKKTVEDPLGDEVSYRVRARFKSRKRLVGWVVQEKGDCSSGRIHFVAKYAGKAS